MLLLYFLWKWHHAVTAVSSMSLTPQFPIGWDLLYTRDIYWCGYCIVLSARCNVVSKLDLDRSILIKINKLKYTHECVKIDRNCVATFKMCCRWPFAKGRLRNGLECHRNFVQKSPEPSHTRRALAAINRVKNFTQLTARNSEPA